MKLSLAWIFDHIVIPPKVGSITLEYAHSIIRQVTRCTTEVELVETIHIDRHSFTVAQCIYQEDDFVILRDYEYSKEFRLPHRPDGTLDAWYLLILTDHQARYATARDVGGSRDHEMPAMHITEAERHGSWKDSIEWNDIRITIENKSITHRPDLWSHRGFAREIVALQEMKLKPLHKLEDPCEITAYTTIAPVSLPYAPRVTYKTCDMFGTIRIDVTHIPSSSPHVAFRLARLDTRPINGIVDLTNYVMLDIGQPLHVFDADCIVGALEVRAAHAQESITLLDQSTHTLTPTDCVVADATSALSLAGIMGGKRGSVTKNTTRVLLESAHFMATAIRQSSSHHHLRTESSARFEKNIDPQLVITGIQRYLYFLKTWYTHTSVTGTYAMALYRTLSHQEIRSIRLTHTLCERMIGMILSSEQIQRILIQLGFTIDAQPDTGAYHVQVPSYRMHDIQIAEDLVEEIARLIGYEHIIPVLPQRIAQPASYGNALRLRMLKQHLSFGLRMQEVHNYAFYDEECLEHLLALHIHDAIPVVNPVSLQWQRLVHSLVPHLLKNLSQNIPGVNEYRLYEVNTVWNTHTDGSVREQKQLAILLYRKEHPLTFYEGKQYAQSITDMLRIPLTWHAPRTPLPVWYHSEQTAELVLNTDSIGYAGMVQPSLLHRIAPGTAYVIELDAHTLLHYTAPQFQYHPISKYPSTTHDISIFIGFDTPVTTLEQAFLRVDYRIQSVLLIDQFTKPEWGKRRSLTFRITIVDHETTMSHDTINPIIGRLQSIAQSYGAELR